ncbi:MAG: DUF2786 domain-containing protein [Desulfobacterales bacterium]|nr:DUF2786 domain-containing protein [Desulfobacterales bacterium]
MVHDLNIRIQEKLEHLIIHGLVCEWEIALWVLEPDERGLLQKPLISIRDLKSKWGYWSGQQKELCLSRDLVLNHGWDSVREVLLHEIAHQYAEQVLGAHTERPHGHAFQQACRRLRANPEASGHSKPLRERLANEATDTNDKIVQRIKKLLSLAQSCNPHESESAMLKAHDLIAKYNINLFKEDTNRNYTSVFAGKSALRHRREEYHLAHLLQDFYFVHGLWVSTYVLDKGRMGHALEISGTPQNIRIASYVYDFVKNYIHSQWESYNFDKGLNRYRRTDFAVGIIEGFRSKLTAKDKNISAHNDQTALVAKQDPQLRAFVDYKYPHTVTRRRNIYNQDETVLNAGIKAGKKLVISKGISERSNAIKLLE